MDKYEISKSTALRDIQSLEMIGMPIFSERGRYGRYGILKNRLLSPIVFTIDEMYALYFSMLTLEAYQSTPFHLDLSKLKQKFESCISQDHKGNLEKMKAVFRFAAFKQVRDSPFLKDILYAAIKGSVHDITYKKSQGAREYTVQFLNISSSFGQWYVTAYEFKSEKLQVFRCDKIMTLSKNESKVSIDDVCIKAHVNANFKDKNATEFEVTITPKGVDLFLKENYPSMQLVYDDGKPIIKGHYNKNEEDFISNYFITYGGALLSIKPEGLKHLIIEKMKQNIEHFKRL